MWLQIKQRPVLEEQCNFYPEAFNLAHPSVTHYWGLQAFRCSTGKDPDCHLPRLHEHNKSNACTLRHKRHKRTVPSFLFHTMAVVSGKTECLY